ncbi:hypothetical protein SNEBB_002300 [Seison nebaliae]|nr:hypothetical protein SNEBB_002300 [Seison nebaliae]
MEKSKKLARREEKKNKEKAEDEAFIKRYSSDTSNRSTIIFWMNAFIISIIPLWLFWKIHMMTGLTYWILWTICSALSTFLVQTAYRNTKKQMQNKIAHQRHKAVVVELSAAVSDKNVKQLHDSGAVQKRCNEIADYEATTFSIFYNNALFLALIVFTAFFLFKQYSPLINYILSMGTAAGLVTLFSTASVKD